MSRSPRPPDGATWRRWGIDPAWSRTLDVVDGAGGTHRWHALDTGAPRGTPGPSATILCVHGNPTWAYAWSPLLARFAGRHRTIAVDQLSMGYSERVGPRRYATRVADLDDVVGALELDPATPLVLAAHDWGGAIAMGWAVERPGRVAAMVLCNTGIAVPHGRRAPGLIRFAASRPVLDLGCRATPAFVEGTVRLSGDRISATDREALRAPYRLARHRRAIAEFVADVPLVSPHPSEGALADVASRLGGLDAPTLLAWGGRDPVFDDDFAADLGARLPNARLQRFPRAGHLVMLEADVAGAADAWISDALERARRPPSDRSSDPLPDRPSGARSGAPSGARSDAASGSLFAGLERRRDSREIAIADPASGGTIDFAAFAARVDAVAAALVRRGLRPGERVAMLTPPGIDLVVAVYGVWRAGGVTAIADRGLGLRRLGAAIGSTRPRFSIGPRAARAASAALGWAPGATRIDVAELMAEAVATPAPPPAVPGPDDEAAILFTSGATGPPKGVRYLHRQLAAQRDALARAYAIGDGDRLVAAFAPFALYGPALGVSTALPDADVTRPGELTARALDEACRAVSATMVFASPAALANVARTAPDAGSALAGLEPVRLVLSAGAPVPSEILRSVAALAPAAALHTPYGMTEALPVADVDLLGIDAAEAAERAAGAAGGVCVGRPVEGAEVAIAPLDFDALAGVPEPVAPGATGEILVRAPWVSEGYLGRWHEERLARPGDGYHRTGDVGHLDADGRLWVEGRAVHVVDTADGPVTSVPLERDVERALVPRSRARAGRVAAVGVGPAGCAAIVVVIEADADGLADRETTALVREAAAHPIAAALTTRALPVDIRHNAKIDRSAVAARASDFLAGKPVAGEPGGRGRRR